MKFEFSIPTPKTCVDCQFHTVETDGRYGPWVIKCLIDKNVKILPRDGMVQRNDECPGKV